MSASEPDDEVDVSDQTTNSGRNRKLAQYLATTSRNIVRITLAPDRGKWLIWFG